MSAAVPLLPPPPERRFTRDEVLRMMDADVFDGLRYELIDGNLIDKTGQTPPHAIAIKRTTRSLVAIFGDRVCVQLPIEVALRDRQKSMPEPDIAVVRDLSAELAGRHPNGDELVLAVEIADSSLRHDTKQKRDLYARAGVPEYWVLDLNSRSLIVHRRLSASGLYLETTRLTEEQAVAIEATGDIIDVSALLPPPVR